MKFALVNGIKCTPKPKTDGICSFCASKVNSKCGDINIWHWAHYSKRECDTWWENETKWHRDWKGHFPIDWQEVTHRADDGERHIADVKTEDGCVMEFQHSFISKEERLSRDNFYPNLVWIVDGLRRKRDKDQFFKAIDSAVTLMVSPLLKKVYIDESKLIKEWQTSSSLVFFDFGEEQRIWWKLPFKDNSFAYFVPFSRTEFIDFQLGKMDVDFISFLNKCIKDFMLHLSGDHLRQQRIIVPNRLSALQSSNRLRRMRRL